MVTSSTKSNSTSHYSKPVAAEQFYELARSFRTPTVAAEGPTRLLNAGQHEALKTLVEVYKMEAEDRLERKIQRLRQKAKLPPGKTFETLDLDKLSKGFLGKLARLESGEFVATAENVVCFGLPGVGKSHVAAAIGDRLVSLGISVYYTPTYRLIQELLAAKRDLDLPRKLRKLDQFEVLILDDIGYIQQSAEEVEVLFTLLAERYERRSVIITSNLVFSQWDKIFKNPMTTAAAIDRVVHHSTILEFKNTSFRTEAAKERKQTKKKPD